MSPEDVGRLVASDLMRCMTEEESAGFEAVRLDVALASRVARAVRDELRPVLGQVHVALAYLRSGQAARCGLALDTLLRASDPSGSAALDEPEPRHGDAGEGPD